VIVEATLRRLSQDGADIRQAARDLGHEIPRNRLDVLARFRAGVAKLGTTGRADFTLGYRAALADVTAAYEAAIEPRIETERLAVIARQRKWWRETIGVLRPGPATVSEVADGIGASLPTTSRVLAAMRKAGLVEMWRYGAGFDGRAGMQALSVLGRRVDEAMRMETGI